MSGKLSKERLKEMRHVGKSVRCSNMHGQFVAEELFDHIDLIESEKQALTAENERLTQERDTAIRERVEAHGLAKRLADDAIVALAGSKIATPEEGYLRAPQCLGDDIKRLRKERDAAQQRLASLEVDPVKREELALGAWRIWYGAYFGTLPRCQFADISDAGKAGWLSIVDYLVPVVAASRDPEVAELQRQLSEANKRLAELTKPADEEELAKDFQFVLERRIGLACWAACEIPWKEAVKEGIRNVRAPLVQQIAELTEKLAAAERTAKAANDGREHAVRNQDRLAAELSATKQALAAMTDERDRARDMLRQAEASSEATQQALAAARGDVEWLVAEVIRIDRMVRPSAQCDAIDRLARRLEASAKPQETRPRIVCLCGSTRFMEAFQKANLDETLAGRIVLSVGCNTKSDGDLFKGADADEIKKRLDKLHKCKIDIADEVLVLDVGGYVGESTKSEIVHAVKMRKPIRYLSKEQPAASSPAPAKAAASEPADHSGDASEPVVKQSLTTAEPAERRFVCPRCGGKTHRKHEIENVACRGCAWVGSWRQVEAALAKDGSSEVEAAKGERAKQSLECKIRKAYRGLNDPLFESSMDELRTLEQQLAAANQAREAAAERWQAKVLELERRCNDEHFKCEAAEQRAAAAEGREAALQSKLNDLEASRKVLKRDAEAAEAAVDALKETIKRVCFVGPADGRICSSCGSCYSPHSPQCEVGKALADPGRAANELRALRELAEKAKSVRESFDNLMRGKLVSAEALAEHSLAHTQLRAAVSDYDQALAQGEQRGEGR